MSRKRLKVFCACLLAMILAFSLVSCGKKAVDTTPPTVAETETEKPTTQEPVNTEPEKVEVPEEVPDPALTQPITRMEVLKHLYEEIGSPEVNAEVYPNTDAEFIKFADVPETEANLMGWYQMALHMMDSNEADGECIFEPERAATRFFMASLLWNDLTNRGFALPEDAEAANFTDLGGDETRRNGIMYLCQKEVMPDSGTENAFNGAGEITVAAAEEIFEAYDGLLETAGIAGKIDVGMQVELAKAVGIQPADTQTPADKKGIWMTDEIFTKYIGKDISVFANAYGLDITDAEFGAVPDRSNMEVYFGNGYQEIAVEFIPSSSTSGTIVGWHDMNDAGQKAAQQPVDQQPEQKPAVIGVTTDAPGLAGYGLTSFVAANTPCTYTTICKKDTSQTTTGTVTFSYSRSDAGGGYDNVTATITTVMSDEAARTWGVRSLLSATDYYLYSDGGANADLDDGSHDRYSITWNGTTYDKCSLSYNESGDWDDSGTVLIKTYTYTAKVPAGYDGFVVWVATHPGTSGMGKHLSNLNGLIMFRCN